MIRGTTPTHIFNLPVETSFLKEVKITYAQGNDEVFTKTKEDCLCEEKAIKVSLTQEETLKFDHTKPVYIQVRVLTVSGDAMASQIEMVDVGKVLNEEVLT